MRLRVVTPAAQERAQHAPGPWLLKRNANKAPAIIRDDKVIAVFYGADRDAVARVAHAAPALLAAAQWAYTTLSQAANEIGDEHQRVVFAHDAAQLLAAITQAKGEKP